MLEITFEYKDKYTRGKWRTQRCTVSSVEECIRIYGLGADCDYKFIEIKEEKDEGKN